MTTIVPTADTALAKARLIRDWHDSGAGRRADLTDWVQTVAADGAPMMSARLSGSFGPNVLAVFGARQETHLAMSLSPVDVLPTLDYSVPGRTGCVWRQDGVWTEVWHLNTAKAPTPRPGPPVAAAGFLRPVPAPPRTVAVTPSAPLPRRPTNRFRRATEETP